MLAGDDEVALRTVSLLTNDTQAARRATQGPHWDLAGELPWIGDDVRTVQILTVVVDDLAVNALGALVDVAGVLDPAGLAPVGGRVDLDPISDSAARVVSADRSAQAAEAALGAIDTEPLLPQLGLAVDGLTAQVNDLAALTATGSRAVRLLPPMLGGEGPRDYLLLVQNNSEPRALGGLPGSYVHLRADDGAITFVESRSAVEVGSAPVPVLELTRAERGLFGTQIGRFPGNVTSTPDFPRAAQLAREFWRASTGFEVDGVIAVDPVALSMLLRATGSVVLPTGEQLTADNASQLLLNQVYKQVSDPSAQDAFFASAATSVFDALVLRPVDPTAAIAALDEMADEGRLMVWSSVHEEQEMLEGTVLSGELRGQVGNSPLVGIYVHDTSGAKIAYYQGVHAEVAAVEMRADGSQILTVTVTVSSQVPAEVESLPPSLTGGGDVVPVGTIRSEISVYAPTNGRILSATSTDPDSRFRTHIHDGLMVGTNVVTLKPGESIDLEFTLESGPRQFGEPMARITPGPDVDQFVARTSS
ncbi:DUF4012 domain-containing protein [Georgenia sp. M64]|uniref:DUF4012 domain-containing protein n=1 Tax=Georgenia sp. M64 TaxID=3120520 RepID=UPI0030DEAEE5